MATIYTTGIQVTGNDIGNRYMTIDYLGENYPEYARRYPSNGGLWTCGYNNRGQLGDGTTANKSSPVQVGSLTNWAQVAAGSNHTAAVKTDGSLWTFGLNNFGQLGDGTITWRSSPVQVGTLTNWAQVAGGFRHTAAVSLS